MLFHWSWTDDQLRSADQAVLRSLTTELIRASRRGHHLVSISRAVAAWLSNNIDLSKSDKAQALAIGNKYTQTGDLHRRAPYYIEIASIGHDFESFDGGAKASAGYIVKSNLLDPGRLIVENVDNDGWLFDLLIRHFRKKIGLAAISVAIDYGGGRDVVRVLSQRINEKRITCLIADSDKKFPADNVSSTIEEAHRICRTSKSPFCFVLELPCHEVENIIPIDVVRSVQSSIGHVSIAIHQVIDFAEKAKSCSDVDRYWLFFDLKKGVSEKTLAEMRSEGALWHSDKLKIAGIGIGQRTIAGFGDRIIPQISTSGSLTSTFLKSIETQQWRSSFHDIFARSCWIFVGDRVNVT